VVEEIDQSARLLKTDGLSLMFNSGLELHLSTPALELMRKQVLPVHVVNVGRKGGGEKKNPILML
jgi:hypothetical protein